MRNKNSIYTYLFLLVTLGCSQDELYPDQYGIQGTWRLYEEGGSPGFGYYITPVPAQPLQSLTFTNKGELSHQGERLDSFFQYPYYQVESTQGAYRLGLVEKKGDSPKYFAGLFVKGDTMRINPTCYEGCHFGFVRIH